MAEFKNKFAYGAIIAANKDINYDSKLVFKDFMYHAGHDAGERGFWLVGDNGVSTIYDPDDFRRAIAVPVKYEGECSDGENEKR